MWDPLRDAVAGLWMRHENAWTGGNGGSFSGSRFDRCEPTEISGFDRRILLLFVRMVSWRRRTILAL